MSTERTSRPPRLAGLAPGSRATSLAGLLVLTLALAGVLAYEAQDASRSHRATAEQALRAYASVAAWEFLASAKEDLHNTLVAALNPVTGIRASSPYDSLPSVAVLARSASGALRCEEPAGDSSRFYFRLDFRNRSLTTAGAAPSVAVREWLADTVEIHARTVYEPDVPYTVLFANAAGRSRALVYGVKYAEFDAPIAAFGFVTCPSALGVPLFRRVLERHALLPASLTGGAANDSILSVTVVDGGGRELYRSSAAAMASAFTGAVTFEKFGGLTARVTLHPAAVRRLPIGRLPRSRLPVLVGLLAATAGLVAVAALQLRRESELARLRADFISSVSHELRTPLAQILLFAETLSLGRVRSDAERSGAADVIVQESRRLMHLVENVLRFARAERGLDHLSPTPTRVASVVRDVLAAFEPLARAGAVTLRAQLDEGAVALADPEALRQVVLNLLDNAVKYGPRGQTVQVSVEAAGDRVRVRVDDEGPGVPPDGRGRVWTPFVRLDRERHAAVGGSGIGLAVVRELVTLQGGAAWVDGAPGGGASFVVELPRAAIAAGPVGDEARGTAATEPAIVTVVDDELVPAATRGR